jgi:soluble lytic murein transglycosylase-like protein
LKKRAVVLTAVAVLLVIAILAVVASRQRVRRHRVFRTTAGEQKPAPPGEVPPVEQWTAAFQSLNGEELAELLAQIETKHPDLYAKYSLAYLHARALVDDDEEDEAAAKLAPYVAKGHPFRELALFHQASMLEGAEASRVRRTLIEEHPGSPYRDEAIDEEIEYLASLDDVQPLTEFAAKLAPAAPTQLRRDMSARIVEALVRTGRAAEALPRGLTLLNGGTTDDASDRASRALDRPELIAKMTAEQWALLGETFQSHRHYDRAAALLQKAIPALPAKFDDLQFALGRSYFGDEKYTEAQQVYLRGAAVTKVPEKKAMFLWHAARAAQLRGDDAAAEQLMTQSIAVPGIFPSTKAAITQRIRTRLKRKQIAAAAIDLAFVRKTLKDRTLLEASLAYAVGMIGAGNPMAALSALNAVPANLQDPYDRAEFAYWRARALEARDPRASFREYLTVLRAPVPTHFAYFARQRLDAAAIAPKLAQELTVREAQVKNLIAAKQWDAARRVQTDRILLSSKDRAAQLQILTSIYREIPTYRTVLELAPKPLPKFPLDDTSDRATLLMAMGLADEAVETIEQRYALAPAATALTRSHALNLGGASRESIYAIEVMMKRVPDDFVPDLLPLLVRQLLYPRYFYDAISADAERYEADPVLVLSIMREESRFNPRAKSQAAARGLLQFIITTARDIGRDVGLVDLTPEDLYDPRVIIRLGAKYVAELMETFGGNRYNAAAAYNAGPRQVALWTRLQAAPGNDYFLTAVNFDETKHYVRKVMNSWDRYSAIYGDGAAVGGLRAEP